MRTDFVWVVPRKIDGSLTRSLSRGRGFCGLGLFANFFGRYVWGFV